MFMSIIPRDSLVRYGDLAWNARATMDTSSLTIKLDSILSEFIDG